MAREATVTQEQVNAAADSLVASGQKPTNRAVLEIVGSGSMATIVKLLQNWRASQVRNAAAAIDDAVEPEVARAISNMLAKRITAATAEANSKVAELQTDLDTVIAENERQAQEIEKLRDELEVSKSLAQSQAGQIEQLTLNAERVREQLALEVKAREAAQVSLAKAELRIESLPDLQNELKAALAEAKKSGEEAAELRGVLAGLEKSVKKETAKD